MTSHTCPTVLYHVACGEPANLRCSRCQAVWYCCKKHQRLDWKVHKLTCTPVVSSAVNVEPTKAQVDAKGTVSPKAVAMSPPGSPPPVSPTGCAETEVSMSEHFVARLTLRVCQFAVQCRGGGYNGGLVDMENSEFVSSSFWKPSHTAYAYELSDDEDDAKAKAPHEEAAPVVPVVPVAPVAPTEVEKVRRTRHTVAPVSQHVELRANMHAPMRY